MKKTTAIFILLLSVSAASASEPTFRYQPEPDFELKVGAIVDRFSPKDAFSGLAECAIADAVTIRQYAPEEAARNLAPCLAAVSGRYQSLFKVRVTNNIPGQENALLGILIEASRLTPLSSPAYRDVSHSLSLRSSSLLGHPAVLRREGEDLSSTRSLAQEALDQCFLPAVIRSIENANDFIRYFGSCLKSNPELRIKDMRPWEGRKLGVILLSAASQPTIEGLNGSVTVATAKGPTRIDIAAYSEPIHLP